MNWIVSNGTFEVGGRVVAAGLPSNVQSGRTYPVNFTFHVDAFDWGSSIRPTNVEWFARIGCVQGDGLSCLRNQQNMTLGSSSIEGNFSRGEIFAFTTDWALSGRIVSDSVQSVLGMRMLATVECWDTKLCFPRGGTNAMTQSSLNPEISITMSKTSEQTFSGNLWWYSVNLWILVVATAAGVFAGFGLWKRYKKKSQLSTLVETV